MFNKILFFKIFGLLLLPYTCTYAQEYKSKIFIGIHAAPTFCSYYAPGQNNHYTTKYEPKIGFINGISTQVNFSPRLAFHAELNYEQLNYKHSIIKEENAIIGVIIPLNKSVKTNFISIPLSFKYNLIKGDKNNLFLHFGNYWNYMIEQYFHVILPDGSTALLRAKSDKHLRMGLLTGIGFDRALSDRMHLTVEIRDHYTLIDDPDAYLNRTTIITKQSNSLGIMVGLLFRLGNLQTWGN